MLNWSEFDHLGFPHRSSAAITFTPREFQVYFNDLQWNDFNTLFQRLCENEADRPNFYAAGVPGSFIGRAFPGSSVHIFVSTLSLHYLSKIPTALTDENSSAFNKGNLWLEGTSDAAAAAYKEQFSLDWNSLLRARSEELIPGGLLCFMIKTRPTQNFKANVLDAEEDSMDAVEICLRETADEAFAKGIITERQLNALNVPMYYPLFQEELLEIVKGFDSEFEVLAAEEVGFACFLPSDSSPESETFETRIGEYITGFTRSILGGGIFGQVMGEKKQDIFWQHYSKVAKRYASAFSKECHYGCIALAKK